MLEMGLRTSPGYQHLVRQRPDRCGPERSQQNPLVKGTDVGEQMQATHGGMSKQSATASESARPDAIASGNPTMSVNKVLSPRIVNGAWQDGHAQAIELREPVFMPIELFSDDRGWSAMNLLSGVLTAEGQINFSMQYPNVVKAWHCHTLQTDFWMCAVGNIKAGVHRPEDQATWMIIMGEKKPGVLIIPPGLWHGATAVGHEPAGLLYYVTHAFNPQKPDELRQPWDSIKGFPWGIRHG